MAADGDHRAGDSDIADPPRHVLLTGGSSGIGLEAAQQLLVAGHRLTVLCRDAATARGLNWRDIPTGIGHDAVYVARRVPTVMLFTPCHGGLSHHEAESISPEWAEAGLRVLADAVIATANEDI